MDLGSQVSPASTTPLPHFGVQSESLLALHPAGQQPSLKAAQVVIPVWLQATLQLALLPVILSMVHVLASSQEVGQDDAGSQVSPGSTTPLPQVGEQSVSVLALHPAGQQPSPDTHVVIAVWLQVALQLALLPVI